MGVVNEYMSQECSIRSKVSGNIECIRIIIQKKTDALIGLIGISVSLSTVFMDLSPILKIFFILVLLLLIRSVWKESKKIQKMYKEKHIPIVVVAGKTDEEFKSTVSSVLEVMKGQGFGEQQYLEDFDLRREDWTVFMEGFLPANGQEWEKVAHSFEKKIIKISEKLNGRKVFHIFLNCPATLAMGMGALVGTKYELVLYHHEPGVGHSPYHRMIDFYSRCQSSTEGIHTITSTGNSSYTFIDIEKEILESPSVWISIYIASHDPKGDMERTVELLPKPVSVIHLRSKLGRNLPIDIDWLTISKEVATELLNAVAMKKVNDVNICLSSPVIIAFVLGMAMGTHSAVTLQNWFRSSQEYVPVLQLNKLRDSD